MNIAPIHVEFEGKSYVIKNGWDVFHMRRSPRGEQHWVRVPHTCTRILEGVRGHVEATHMIQNPGKLY